jgi:hypothetical protein
MTDKHSGPYRSSAYEARGILEETGRVLVPFRIRWDILDSLEIIATNSGERQASERISKYLKEERARYLPIVPLWKRMLGLFWIR